MPPKLTVPWLWLDVLVAIPDITRKPKRRPKAAPEPAARVLNDRFQKPEDLYHHCERLVARCTSDELFARTGINGTIQICKVFCGCIKIP